MNFNFLEQFLSTHQIQYARCDHPPVFTCEEAERLVPPLNGAKTKNLFLRDKKGKNHFLVTVSANQSVDLKALGPIVNASGGLSLASSERLEKYLGVTPGAVTILSVINDPDGYVQLFIDRSLWHADAFLCHPLVNTSTLTISKSELTRFLDLVSHPPIIIEVPSRI